MSIRDNIQESYNPFIFSISSTLIMVLYLLIRSGAPATAEATTLPKDVEILSNCLSLIHPDSTNPPVMSYGADCEFNVANLCYDEAEYRDANVGRGCVSRELKAWNFLVDREFDHLIYIIQNEIPPEGDLFPLPMHLARELRASQNAWEDFRGHHCSAMGASFRGSGSSDSVGYCRLRMTADRFLYLRGLSRGYIMERY